MSHDVEQHCDCMATHAPAPLELEYHHIWPLGMGGPDVASNKVWLCPTAHTNVHELLRLILRSGGTLTWRQVLDMYEQPVNRYAWAVAWDGYTRYVQGTGLASTPT